MAIISGSSSGHSWPDLPAELFGLVLSWLPSHADRVRIAAVCRPWRSSARLLRPLAPLLPWLALCDGTFLSFPDGAVHRLPIAEDVTSRLSTGSRVFLLHGDDTCSLMDPLSATTTTPLPELAACLGIGRIPIVRKVVVSDHLIAALVDDSTTRKVIISTRGQQRDIIRCSTMEWQEPAGSFIGDIALFKGKLCIITTEVKRYQRELHVLDDDGQVQRAICCIPGVDGDDDEELGYNSYSDVMYVQQDYLAVSGGQLLLVERRIYQPSMLRTHSGIQKQTYLFKVFEAADMSSSRGRWIEVDSLMGRALFVSEGCSESLPAAAAQCGNGGIREDCVYFINEHAKYTEADGKKVRENPMLDSGVYNMRDRSLTPLLLETTATPAASDGPWHPTWLFPDT